MQSQLTAGGHDQANLRFSKKLAAILVAGVALLIVVSAVTSLWTSGQHNALARENAERMVRGGFASLEDRLDTVIRDYSLWTEAFQHITAQDLGWAYANIGIGAAETGSADLMIVVEPGERASYGWVGGMGETPSSDLLPPSVIATALRLLEPLPVDQAVPVNFYTRVNGTVWLLAVCRVLPWEGLPEGTADADLPRHLFGFRITDEVAARIGADFLIEDVRVTAEPRPEVSSLPLRDASGAAAAYVIWAPPRPGAAILRSTAAPLGLILALIAVAAAVASRHVVLSARRLEQALAADRSKSEFLANVSHDLRTPMTGVIGIGQLLRQTALDEKQDKMLGIMLSSAAAQMTLIDNLLDVARIEAGVRALDKAPFEPAVTVDEALGILAPEAARKGLELRADLGALDGITVLGDREAFRRIVTNLVGNAVKFTRKGHVAVSLSAACEAGRAEITLCVADTGPGIDPEQQKRIFERFARVESQALPEEGFGLGLAITKSLAEMMGGRVSLSSEPGQGASFTVTASFELHDEGSRARYAA